MEAKMKIMIIEDDETLVKEISRYLIKWGYDTKSIEDFSDILTEFTAYAPELILMDVNLPMFDGFYWCRQIRESSTVPIIYISSRGDDRDKIMAIAQGGDDYLEKPFHLELLKAKIEAMLRRTYHYKERERTALWGGLVFDRTSSILFVDGKEVELTKSERRILSKLLSERPDVVTREELMMELWNTDEYVSDGTLTTVISRLRSRLKEACGEEVIATKKGQGYFIP